MENLNKQGGEKSRKMEVKVDKDSAAHQKPIEKKTEEVKTTPQETESEKTQEAKTEKKVENKPVAKKDMAYVKMNGLAMSTKQSREISRFLIGKTPEQAIEEMTRVTKQKMAVPMRGEIPHRRGPMMSGRYPINTAKVFINVLKSLAGNASVNGIRNPVITISSASWAARPKRKGGMRFKRTHLYMEVREAKEKQNNKMKNKKHSENKTTDGKK